MYFLKAVISLFCCCLLVACGSPGVGTSPPSSLDNLASKNFKVREGLSLLNDYCIKRPVTFSGVLSEANRRRISFSGSRLSGVGSSLFDYDPPVMAVVVDSTSEPAWRNSEAQGKEYRNYLCALSFRGKWADQLSGEIHRQLIENGFSVVEPLQRKEAEKISGLSVAYTGVYRRNGQKFRLTVEHGGGTVDRQIRLHTHYISGTIVALDGLTGREPSRL